MSNLLSQTKLFWKRHGSTILTYVGGAGVVATTVLAVKATPKALQNLDEAREEKGEELTRFETIKTAGPVYIPTIVTGAATIACIFGANVMNQRRQASLIGAYAALDMKFKDYKKKVEELYGQDANENVQNELAKDRYDGYEVTSDKKLFYDYFSERYFESTEKEVLEAEYKVNRQLALNSGVFLNEFYEFLDIPQTIEGTELGWSQGIMEAMYWTNWIDFDHSVIILDDDIECTIIHMRQEPVIDFAYY